jgi:hypothetical protein
MSLMNAHAVDLSEFVSCDGSAAGLIQHLLGNGQVLMKETPDIIPQRSLFKRHPDGFDAMLKQPDSRRQIRNIAHAPVVDAPG